MLMRAKIFPSSKLGFSKSFQQPTRPLKTASSDACTCTYSTTVDEIVTRNAPELSLQLVRSYVKTTDTTINQKNNNPFPAHMR